MSKEELKGGGKKAEIRKHMYTHTTHTHTVNHVINTVKKIKL